MSFLTYPGDNWRNKPVVWLAGKIESPPFSIQARREAGALIRALQNGFALGMPHSRPMPTIGPRCHELRVEDEGCSWRIVYRTDRDAILIADIFRKKTEKTPGSVIAACRQRLKRYDNA
ncbi:type II toxin-antitoxin system RelE/ParE family toxin [bacterium]|nr:MAG: type II toxin-antitoxin system RelE/ParE family toxin [bacterium]